MRRSEKAFLSDVGTSTAAKLGVAVKAARLARGRTQQDTAERARCSKPTVSRIERGDVSVSLSSWLGVLEAVDLLHLLSKLAEPAADAAGEALRATQTRQRGTRSDRKTDDFDF